MNLNHINQVRDTKRSTGLQTLLERFYHLGVWADLAALSIINLWGLHCFVRYLAGGE